MKRIYHDYRRWEDFKCGMWRRPSVDEYDSLLKTAIDFTGDHIKYGQAMMKVIKKWKYSCEHNLTDMSINRKAWIGHSACCLELSLPESVVRHAWGLLTDEQRRLANLQAESAIKEYFNKKNNQLSIW